MESPESWHSGCFKKKKEFTRTSVSILYISDLTGLVSVPGIRHYKSGCNGITCLHLISPSPFTSN